MERITKVTITWADADWEYEFELTGSEAEDFKEKYAEEYAREDAEEKGTVFEELISVDLETEEIDENEFNREQYEIWAEFEWELRTGR
ncbi:MAG: hypothetical protein NC320_01125 [Clostridium sp.]|nr:hypothetical protein [Clostridium sp.]